MWSITRTSTGPLRASSFNPSCSWMAVNSEAPVRVYIVCGEHVLCARLRPSNIDGAQGSVAEVERIVAQIRQAWPQVRIILRGDSGFCRDELLSWCEEHGVDYVVGLAQNARLLREIATASAQAASPFEQSGTAARVFSEFV